MALVLNRHTGHVSPQFHVRFDKSFETMQQEHVNCNWQKQTFFIEQNQVEDKGERIKSNLKRYAADDNQREGAPNEPKRQRGPEDPSSIGQEIQKEPQREGEDQQAQVEVDAPIFPQTRSGRQVKPPDRLTYSITEVQQTPVKVSQEIFDPNHVYPRNISGDHDHPYLAYKATSDPDTMYLH